MNFKKFISGVSALAIAASAFAGMAVTASAAKTVTGFDTTKNVTLSTLTLDEGVEDTLDKRIAAFNTQAFGDDSSSIRLGRYSSTTLPDLDATLAEGKLSVRGTLAKSGSYRGGFALYEGNSTDKIYGQSQYIQFTVDSYSDNAALVLLSTKTNGTGSYGTQWSSSNKLAAIKLSDLNVKQNDVVKVGCDTTATPKIANFYVNGSLKHSQSFTNNYLHDIAISAENTDSRNSVGFSFAITNFSAGDYIAPTHSIEYVSNGAEATVADSAKEGSTVSVSVPTEKDNYISPTVSVVDANNHSIALTEVRDAEEKVTGYSFTMPDSDITVTASATSLTAPAYTVPTENVTNAAYVKKTSGSDITTLSSTQYFNGLTGSETDISYISDGLSKNETNYAVTKTNVDFLLADSTSSIMLGVVGRNSGKAQANTFIILKPGTIAFKTASGTPADNEISGMNSGNWYRMTITTYNRADTLSVDITTIDGVELYSNTNITQRNKNNAFAAYFAVANATNAYLANVYSYNPTVTYSYYADGVKVGEGVTVVEGCTPTAPVAPAKDGYTFKEWEIDANDATVYNAVYEAVTAPTATAAWLRDYTDLESGQNGASVWALTVVPGTYTVNKIGLSLNGSDVAWDNHDNLNISGEVIFAAVLNKIQSEVHSLTAYFNDGSLYATAYTD